jgi:uncharacterized membrane protein YeiH
VIVAAAFSWDWDWLRELLERDYFDLPLSFSIVAYFAFGLTGALAAAKRGYDFIGVYFLALITAGGGGLIRDGLLISSGPPVLVTDPMCLIVVLVATIATSLFHRGIHRLARTIAVIDAVGLGAFAVYGVQTSLDAGLSVPGAILGGTITAVGGGLLRDILVRDEPLVFKPGQFYAFVAIGGCVLFIILERWGSMHGNLAALITIVATFTLRLLSISFNWRTSAFYREPPPVQPPTAAVL